MGAVRNVLAGLLAVAVAVVLMVLMVFSATALKAPAILKAPSSILRSLAALALSLFLMGDKGGDTSLITSLAFLIQVMASAWYVKLEQHRSHRLDFSAGVSADPAGG